MKNIIITLFAIFLTTQAQAASLTLLCQGDVFYSKDHKFEVTLRDGLGSSIEYLPSQDNGYAYIPIVTRINSDKTIFKVISETNEGGTVRIKIDLTAQAGKMISLYDTPWDMDDDKPYKVTGTCYKY